VRNWRTKLVTLSLLALLGFTAWGTPARAGLDIDLGAKLRINDDTDVFIAVSSRYFQHDREVVVQWRDRYDDPDDCTVALFLSRRSGKSPRQIFILRREGLSWWEIGLRLEIPAEVWFITVSHDPGPPYGNAYGHWRKHKKNPKHQMTLTDAEVRNLVSIRMIHEYYGISANVAMKWRASGKDIQTLMAGEYRKRHGSNQRANVLTTGDSPAEKPGKSKSKGKK
jgi:hypothetical protein